MKYFLIDIRIMANNKFFYAKNDCWFLIQEGTTIDYVERYAYTFKTYAAARKYRNTFPKHIRSAFDIANEKNFKLLLAEVKLKYS